MWLNFLGLFFRTGKIFFGLTRFSCLSVRMTDNFSASFGKSARVGGLADPVPSRPKVGIPTLSTVTHTFSRPVNTTGSFSTAPGSAMGLNLSGSRPPFFHMGTAYRVLPYLLCRLGLVHHGMYPLSLILALSVLTLCLLASASSFQSGYHKDSGYL